MSKKYALIIIGDEVWSNPPLPRFSEYTGERLPEPDWYKKRIMAHKGQRFLVENDSEGWVEATGSSLFDLDDIEKDVKTFSSKEKAESFAKRWKGHPWWVKPIGYVIIEIEPLLETRIKGWKLTGECVNDSQLPKDLEPGSSQSSNSV